MQMGFANTPNDLIRQAPGPLNTVIVNLAPVPLWMSPPLMRWPSSMPDAVKHGRRLVLAGVRDPVRDTLARASLLSVLGEENIFRNMQTAVEAATAVPPTL